MSFHIYNELTRPTEHTYKLIQLPKELVEYIKEKPGKPLQFKAPVAVTNQLAICTDAATYTVRQMNHSNTQLLVNDMAVNVLERSLEHAGNAENAEAGLNLLAVGLASYLYELSASDGHIETDGLPTYEGAATDLLKHTRTLAEVENDSPIASECFLARWHDLCGSVVDGKAVILSAKIVTDLLHTIISLMIAEKSDGFETAHMAAMAAEHNLLYTADLVATVASKFRVDGSGRISLDEEKVAKWFGIEALRNQRGALSEKALLLEWKASLPPFYNASLDLKLLLGHYCRPGTGQIRYIRAESLSTDLHARIKEMFSIVKEWDFDEFLPFVTAFIPASKKPDAVILKYARKKRVGRKFVVCPR